MPSLRLYFLGPPRIERDGRLVTVDTQKAIALLAYLALTARTHRREVLATLLWPELTSSRARAALRRTLSTLRRTIGSDWLFACRHTISLQPAPAGTTFWLDVAEFQGWLTPPSGDSSQNLANLTQAVALYRDDFLAGFGLRDSPAFDEWQSHQAISLHRHLTDSLETLARGFAAQGDLETAVSYSRQWLAFNPLHEAACRHLMRLHARAGHRVLALRAFQDLAQRLQAELDVTPDPRTVALYWHLRETGKTAEQPAVHGSNFAQARILWQWLGQVRGTQALLLHLLTTKFGQLPAEIMAGIEQITDEASLQALSERILHAQTFADLGL